MAGRVYAFANQKGGVGKTTTAVNLAACLAEAGERALVVDLDPQANATSGLGMRANGTSSYDLLDGAPLAELAKPTAFPNLFLVPSKPELAGAAVELSQRDDGERFLAEALAGANGFDFVLLDCPPSLGPLTVNALAAADRVIVPVQAEYYALEGLAQLMQSINLIKARLNPRLAVAGVLITMSDGAHEARGRRRGARCAGTSATSSSRRSCRARCASPRRRATACPSPTTTAARAAPRPTGRWRWSLSSAASTLGGRRGLGRGFEVLIGGSARARELAHLPVEQIHANPRQPRRRFDHEATAGLADSIRTQGVVQPVVVRPRARGRLRADRRRAPLARRARGGHRRPCRP